MVKFSITKQSKLEIGPASMSIADIQALISICQTGLPEKISPDMKEAIETLVCLCINPIRGCIEGME